MKRWALIDPEARVAQIVQGEPFPVHEGLKWLDVTGRPEVRENMIRGTNGRFADPPRPDLDASPSATANSTGKP